MLSAKKWLCNEPLQNNNNQPISRALCEMLLVIGLFVLVPLGPNESLSELITSYLTQSKSGNQIGQN